MKLFSVVFLGLFCVIIAKAGEVPISKARQVAKNLYFERANLEESISKDQIVFSDEFTVKQNSTSIYHVFNLKDNKGFVVISADDAVYPVLCYSFNGSYETNNPPPAFVDIMENYKQQILYVKNQRIAKIPKINNEWNKYISGNPTAKGSHPKSVSPLVSTLWNQETFFNDSCPADAYGPGGHALTGCVATAMGMLMKYYEYPTQGIGSHSYHHTPANGFTNFYGLLKAHYGNTTYNYSPMQDTVNSATSAMAQLLYH